MAQLTAMPAEILHLIFQWLQAEDLAALPRVCRSLHSFVQGNQKLCRDIYLGALDSPPELKLDWEHELHDLVRLRAIQRRPDGSEKASRLSFVHDTVNRLLKNASPSQDSSSSSSTHHASRNASLLNEIFEDEGMREAFLQRSSLFDRVRNEYKYMATTDALKQESQQSAKLHCLYGQPILNAGRLRSDRTYPYACSKVYDLRQYTRRTKWGPFMDDDTDRVDWEKVEAILIVLGHNMFLRRLASRIPCFLWATPFSGSWSHSYKPAPDVELSELDAKDPYGITGSWCRVVCFLDYNDFFNFNFHIGDPVPRHAPRPALNVGEATRLILMKLHVTGIEPPGPEDGQALPVVHFHGTSQSLDDAWDQNAHSEIRGTVRLTKEGEVRWTTFSIYHGEERWRSEGIQVGGVRSARGVVGNWFDRDYDIHGPAGPSAFWKVHEDPQQFLPLPDEAYIAYSILVGMVDSDAENEMDYENNENDEDGSEGEDDDDDDEDDEEVDPAAAASELPGLLLDADFEIIDLTPHEVNGS